MNKTLINELKKLVIQAGAIAVARRNSGLKIERKEDKSPVTNADREISDLIYEKLAKLTPDIPIICEEQPLKDIKSKFWLVDPIDGTRSYIKRENSFTVNIGLIEDNQPICGFIYQPEVEKLYYTDQNGKLKIECAGQQIELHEKNSQDNYVATVSSHYLNLATRYFLKNHQVSNLIRIPSSIKLCLIADGAADIYPRFGRTMEWDIAAGHALIKARGGDIVDIEGKTISYGKPNFENPSFFACSREWRQNHDLTSLTNSK